MDLLVPFSSATPCSPTLGPIEEGQDKTQPFVYMSGSASLPYFFCSSFSFCCSSFTCCSASLTFTSCFASSTSCSDSFTSCSASFTSPCPPHAATPNIEVKAATKRITIFLLISSPFEQTPDSCIPYMPKQEARRTLGRA